METIRTNDFFSFQYDEKKQQSRIISKVDNKKTNINKGKFALVEFAKISGMRESDFCAYCKGLIYN